MPLHKSPPKPHQRFHQSTHQKHCHWHQSTAWAHNLPHRFPTDPHYLRSGAVAEPLYFSNSQLYSEAPRCHLPPWLRASAGEQRPSAAQQPGLPGLLLTVFIRTGLQPCYPGGPGTATSRRADDRARRPPLCPRTPDRAARVGTARLSRGPWTTLPPARAWTMTVGCARGSDAPRPDPAEVTLTPTTPLRWGVT